MPSTFALNVGDAVQRAAKRVPAKAKPCMTWTNNISNASTEVIILIAHVAIQSPIVRNKPNNPVPCGSTCIDFDIVCNFP